MPFPRIAPIYGRETDYLVDRDGGKVFGLNASFDDYPLCAYAFQYVQHKPGDVELLVVPNRAHLAYATEVQAIAETLRRRFGDRIMLRVRYVDDIPHDGGKLRMMIKYC